MLDGADYVFYILQNVNHILASTTGGTNVGDADKVNSRDD
jgi:hypothetical protein